MREGQTRGGNVGKISGAFQAKVYTIAQDYSTFLAGRGKNCDVLSATAVFLSGQCPRVLILDAFNSDSIRSHLVSKEAIQMFLSKLKPDGLMVRT